PEAIAQIDACHDGKNCIEHPIIRVPTIHRALERHTNSAPYNEGRHHADDDSASAPSGQRPCQSDDETACDWCRGIQEHQLPERDPIAAQEIGSAHDAAGPGGPISIPSAPVAMSGHFASAAALLLCRGVEDFGWPPKSFESSVVVLKAARLRHVRTFAST